MRTLLILNSIRKLLRDLEVEFEENCSYQGLGLDGKFYERDFVFKVGTDKHPLYIDYCPRETLSWYDDNLYTAKVLYFDDTYRLYQKTGVKVLLISEEMKKPAIMKLIETEVLKNAEEGRSQLC